MKIYLSLLVFFVVATSNSYAQKFGYINSEVILKKMPEYKEAEQELDRLAKTWEAEVDKKRASIDSMRKAFLAEEVLLTADMKNEKLEEISKKEQDLREYQSNAFGYEGLLFVKRQELVEPLQQKIFEASERVAKEKKLAMLLDKAGDLVMLYTDPRHNYTDYVLEKLGLGDPIDTPENARE